MQLSKLLGSITDKLFQKVLTVRRRSNREPEIADFIQFVNEKTRIITYPVLSKEALEQYVEKKSSHHKRKISAFPTGHSKIKQILTKYEA